MTGLVHGLGLSLPADLLVGGGDNPSHNESRSLTQANEAILGILGGSWDSPPELARGWQWRPDIVAVMEMMAKVAADAFPRPGPAVWKDPRTALLLPCWTQALGPIAGIVLVWRSPVAVARSLAARDGISVDTGLGLWRRYNEDALRNVAGHHFLVVDYDEMVDDPQAVSTMTADWLQAVVPGLVPRKVHISRAGDSVMSRLRHHTGGGLLPEGCAALSARLTEMRGPQPARPGARVQAPAPG
ncbi:MAG TPA: hypothetical protein VID75_10105 [Acidimicrobiales bacterium]